VSYVDRFKQLPIEKKLLVLFFLACLASPFIMARSLSEVGTHSLPLFVWFHAEAVHWFVSGKPFWQVALACYGVSTVQLLLLWYPAIPVIRKVKVWWRKGARVRFGNRFGFSLRGGKMNSFIEDSRENFGGWLERRNIIVILLVYSLPIPIPGVNMTAAAFGAKRIKYGYWYIAAVNLVSVLAVVSLTRFLGDLWFF
jgi:hypothetical protein